MSKRVPSHPSHPSQPAVLHPIQIVTRRTGVSADVLRVWEKRYAVVNPVRSANGRRLYSDADIARLRLLVQATRTGRSIGQVADIPSAALVTLLSNEDGTPPVRPAGRGPAVGIAAALPAAGDLFDACAGAIAAFDAVALDLLLRRAIIALSADEFLDALVVPLVDHLRVRVLDGSLRRSHGHLAHAVLRRVLDHVVATATAPLASRDLVVATLGGPAHEIDALIVAAAAAADGWRVAYVGPGVPVDDVAETLEQIGARVLVLSLGATPSDRAIPRELRRLRALLPARVDLLVVGATGDVHRAALTEIGATALVGLAMLRMRLHALRSAQPRVTDRADGAMRRRRARSRPRLAPVQR